MPRFIIPPGSTREFADYNRQIERQFDDERAKFRTVRTVTASGAITLNDYTVLVNAASGAVTMTLPPAYEAKGQVFHVKKIDATGNAVTLDGNSSDTIDGAANKSTTTQWTGFAVQSDGTAWFLL